MLEGMRELREESRDVGQERGAEVGAPAPVLKALQRPERR
jgi:hypothetical protein